MESFSADESAEIYRKVTGSTGARYIVERRNADGTLTTVAEGTAGIVTDTGTYVRIHGKGVSYMALDRGPSFGVALYRVVAPDLSAPDARVFDMTMRHVATLDHIAEAEEFAKDALKREGVA